MSGYKHTNEALAKSLALHENKANHPMFGNTHIFKLCAALISKNK